MLIHANSSPKLIILVRCEIQGLRAEQGGQDGEVVARKKKKLVKSHVTYSYAHILSRREFLIIDMAEMQ